MDWMSFGQAALVIVPVGFLISLFVLVVLRTTKPTIKKDLIPISINDPNAEQRCREVHENTWEKIHLGLGKYTYSCHVCQKFRRKS